MSETDQLPLPLFYREAGKAPVATLTEAAAITARPNEDVAVLRNRWKNLAARRLIHPRVVPGANPRDPAYFGCLDDIPTGEILLALFDAGVHSDAIAQAVSLACYSWDDTANPRPAYIDKAIRSPVSAAVVGCCLRGESWALGLRVFHDEKIGQRHVMAVLFNTDIGVPDVGSFLPPTFALETDIAMQITRLMLRFGRFLREPAPTHH